MGLDPDLAGNERSKRMSTKRILMPVAMLLLISLSGSAGAGQITNLQFYDGTSGSPIVTVTDSEPDGTGRDTAGTYADPMVSRGTTAPLYDCIDPWHDNDLGATYAFAPMTPHPHATSTFADVGNRLAWLINQPQATADDRAAVQLALWYTIDDLPNAPSSGFSYTGGDGPLRSEYNDLISFAGYDQTVRYAANFWAASHDPANGRYQDLISAVPEPGAVLLQGVGLIWLGFEVVRRRWRRRSA